jgi:hypothetical protein
MVQWDDDLQHNSDNSMETLVRMGEKIGQRRNEKDRQEYLSTASKVAKKNSTITQLLSHFPTTDSIKN